MNASKWQPIETAPKSDNIIFGCDPENNGLYLMRWCFDLRDGGVWAAPLENNLCVKVTPKYWKPYINGLE